MKRPRDQFSQYAFGHSDKKPDRYFWGVYVMIVSTCVCKAISLL